MRQRRLGVLCRCVTSVTVAVVVMLPVLVRGQDLTADSGAPRTAWGDPDLQGLWNNGTITPLERPASLEDREFLTAEEVAGLERAAAVRVAEQNAPSEVRTQPLPAGGNVASYNSYWTEQGTNIVPTGRTSLITDPPDGRLPALTPEALARITSAENRRVAAARDGVVPADGPEDMGLSERCLWYRGIPTFPTGYNNNYHIFQNQNFVVILQEHIHDLRVITLDGREHLPSNIRQFAGSSVGHWEGDTLVVETTNLRSPFIRRWNRPEHSLSRGDLSESVHVLERFRRIGTDTLDYEFTVTDLETWETSWSGSLPWVRADGPMFEFACHEGNYGMMNMMTGARADEGR